jgi:hypothetical protein
MRNKEGVFPSLPHSSEPPYGAEDIDGEIEKEDFGGMTLLS